MKCRAFDIYNNAVVLITFELPFKMFSTFKNEGATSNLPVFSIDSPSRSSAAIMTDQRDLGSFISPCISHVHIVPARDI